MAIKLITFTIFTMALFPSVAVAQFSLWMTEKKVEMRFSVQDLGHQKLHDLLKSKDKSKYILFDVRLLEEYQKSHLEGANQIDPEMSAEEFLKGYSALIKGKQLVFYCSVGYRSSMFIERLQKQGQNPQSDRMFNLRGGIFRWYNQGHQVVDQQGVTDNIHPYDDNWGKMINPRATNNRPD